MPSCRPLSGVLRFSESLGCGPPEPQSRILSIFLHSRCAISQIAVRKIVAHKVARAETSGSGAMIEYGHFIGGKQVAGKSGRPADVFQPMDGAVRAHVALASKTEMRAAVENAKAAQPA